MDTNTLEAEDLARFALGKRVGRNARIRRALIARLINENAESEDEAENGDPGEGGDEERQLVRLLTGSRLLRRRRLRRLVLAHLINERGESDEFDDEEAEDGEEGTTDDRQLARLLIGNRMLRRRRVRRALLAHLIKQRSEAGEDVDAGESEGEGELDDEGGGEGRFVRMVVGSRLLRRRRVRRALLAHLLKERGDAGEDVEGEEGDESEGDEDTDLERQVARLLIGRRVVKRRRKRRALAAYLRDEGGFN